VPRLGATTQCGGRETTAQQVATCGGRETTAQQVGEQNCSRPLFDRYPRAPLFDNLNGRSAAAHVSADGAKCWSNRRATRWHGVEPTRSEPAANLRRTNVEQGTNSPPTFSRCSSSRAATRRRRQWPAAGQIAAASSGRRLPQGAGSPLSAAGGVQIQGLVEPRFGALTRCLKRVKGSSSGPAADLDRG